MASAPQASDKPLPVSPPPKASSKGLTIESRNHLRQFLSHLLEEETGYRDADKDAWVTSIEGALNDLAGAVKEGMWLAGVRRTRIAKRERKEQARAERMKREQELAAKEDPEARNKAKNRPSSVADAAKQTKETNTAAAEAKTEAPRALKVPSEDTNRNLLALQQLRNLANRRPLPSSGNSERSPHLLLTVVLPDTPSPRPFPSVNAGDATTPRCAFSPGVYSLPPPDLFGEDPDDNNEAVINSALYGFKEWDVSFPEAHDKIELIGGTFKLNSVSSIDEHASLVRVLRVTVYVLLSLLLEQSFLSNSSIELHYPKPSPSSISFPLPAPILHRNSSPDVQVEEKQQKRNLFRQGIWSFIHKRLPRSITVNSSEPRDASLDFSPRESDTPARASIDTSPGATQPRQRRFSIFGESRATPPAEPPQTLHDNPYQTALQRVKEGRALLSTSPGLVIPLPQLLVRLAELEKANPTRRLTGEERTGLTSILGWEGKKAALHGSMTGTAGFLRQQQLSLLYSEYVYDPDRASQSSAPDGSPMNPVDAQLKPHTQSGVHAHRITYMYYGGDDYDQCLGDMITSLCSRAAEPCPLRACKIPQQRHERRWSHSGIRVTLKMEPQTPFASSDIRSQEIEMWQSCKICQESTARCNMSDGTYLFSFAKFLELLFYSPTICTLSHTLCTHTSPSGSASSSLPASRFNIIRHFSHKSYRVSFTLSPTDDIYDLIMPKLQFTKGGWVEKPPQATPAADDTDKKELRQEIKHWWQAISEHLDKMEAEFTGGVVTHRKSLPRLPSEDDDWETSSEERLTPKGLPASLPPNPTHSAQPSSSSLATITPTNPGPDPSSEAALPSDDPNASESPIHLLMNIRFAFQRAEQALYSQLRDTSNATLNDVRREFHSAAQAASRRLAAWEGKHMSKDARQRIAASREAIPKPQWWHSGYHAVPGGSVIVQEEDWGSIIAFTLSSLDYQQELATMLNPRAAQPPSAPPPSRSAGSRQTTLGTLGRSSASASTSSFKFFGSAHKPDPDREDSVWHEPEICSAVITRKEHPRDPTALLSLRDVLRNKVAVDGGSGAPSSIFPSLSRMTNNGVPPMAWAKPAVEVNVAAVDGKVTCMPEAVVTAGQILHELDSASVVSSKTNSSFVETNVHRGKTSSILSQESTGTVGPAPAAAQESDIHSPTPLRATTSALVDPSSRSSTASTMQDTNESTQDGSVFSWTHSLTNAMRYMLKAEFPVQSPPVAKNHHGLLSADPLTIDERPHIKYDWTIGKRLKFSCTVYYAKQFHALRRRCGVEEVFSKSMAKCENWKAEGGKSRSNFWKTSDSRFIIKSLVNAWNVADLQVLIDVAPSYFSHMESTASRASILAKLLGFYTVEIRNLETGTVQAKADLLVMENLFYGQNPSRTFDLKGIQGRKVKANSSSSTSKTLFDSEWIEGQQRALTLVNPVSKVLLQEAMRADCDFLASGNIMDYSLLLGVNGERKQIYCGLVDTIGSYTFAKTLEYKAKGFSGKDGKNITVVPPHEYKERFVSALDGYFLACPDKWTKPPDEKKLIDDPALLPSVL